MKKTVVLMVVLLFLGCAVRPTPEQLAKADYGPYPEGYEQIIKDHYSMSLFDPYSAVYTFRNTPRSEWNGLFGLEFGWIVCGTINAKNRMGGYVGAQPFYVMIRNERVVKAFEDTTTAEAFCPK